MQTKQSRKNSLDDSFSFGPSPFNVTFVPERIGTWVIDIDDCIESVGQFTTAIQALERATEDDSIQINLQCDGGSLGATDAFLHAMRKCEAHIHIVATGGVHSSGTLILLEAHSLELSSGFHALLHCGSLGTYGNLNEYKEKAAFDAKFMPRILAEAYEGFLSEDEIAKLLDGKDIWLDATQWQERHQARNEYFQVMAAEMAELEEGAVVVEKPIRAKPAKTKG